MANQKQMSGSDGSKNGAPKIDASQTGGMLEGLPDLQQAHSELAKKGATDFKADQQVEAAAKSKDRSDDR